MMNAQTSLGGDFLLDMDFDELVPVANFFDQYVDELMPGVPPGQSARRTSHQTHYNNNSQVSSLLDLPPHTLPLAHSNAPDPLLAAMQHHGAELAGHPATGAAFSDLPTPMATGANHEHDHQGLQALLATSPTRSAGARSSRSRPHSHVDALSHLSALRDGPDPLTTLATMDLAMRPGDSPPPRMPRLPHANGAQGESGPESAAGVGEHDSAGMGPLGGGVTKMGKSERQQMLNKAAQQRYRERKKARANELELAVKELEDKVKELTVVQGEKQALQERVNALESDLAERDGQLAQVRQEGGLESSGGQQGPEPDDASSLALQYHSYVAEIRTFLTANNLVAQDTTFEKLQPEEQAVLQKQSQNVYRMCMRIHRASVDVDTWRMIEASVDKSRVHLDGDAATWASLVSRLHLTCEAVQKAETLRDVFLKKLDDIYNARQSLNLEAVKALLPEDAGGLQPEGRAKWFAFKGFFKRQKHVSRVAGVMARLRANLIEEQKALGELDCLVLTRLLDPLQAAYCIVQCYPVHCDVVSLLNAVHAHHAPASVSGSSANPASSGPPVRLQL